MQISYCYDLVSVETMKFILTVMGKYVIISVTTVVHVAARMKLCFHFQHHDTFSWKNVKIIEIKYRTNRQCCSYNQS